MLMPNFLRSAKVMNKKIPRTEDLIIAGVASSVRNGASKVILRLASTVKHKNISLHSRQTRGGGEWCE